VGAVRSVDARRRKGVRHADNKSLFGTIERSPRGASTKNTRATHSLEPDQVPVAAPRVSQGRETSLHAIHHPIQPVLQPWVTIPDKRFIHCMQKRFKPSFQAKNLGKP
jgi:nucleoid-associated protein YgaU